MRLLLAVGVLLGVVASAASLRSEHGPVVVRPDPMLGDASMTRDADIEFFRARVAEDSLAAIDNLRLATLYLLRAREQPAGKDLEFAHKAASRSLEIRPNNNPSAWHLLALALMGEHRFQEALAAADSLLATGVPTPDQQALRGEILLELGDYSAANSVFTHLDHKKFGPSTLARVARWAMLNGDNKRANALLLAGQGSARKYPGTSAEQLAWFEMRLAETARIAAQPKAARTHFTRAEQLHPGDVRVALARAQFEAEWGSAQDAQKAAATAVKLSEDPLRFALASNAAMRLGDSAQAERWWNAFITTIAGIPEATWHRTWHLALLDRGEQVGRVLQATRSELANRHDVYGWDQYAWALHKSGKDQQAKAAMLQAVKLGTEDPRFWEHAKSLGMTK